MRGEAPQFPDFQVGNPLVEFDASCRVSRWLCPHECGRQNCSAPLPGFWKEALDFKLFATDNTAVQNTHVPTVFFGTG